MSLYKNCDRLAVGQRCDERLIESFTYAGEGNVLLFDPFTKNSQPVAIGTFCIVGQLAGSDGCDYDVAELTLRDGTIVPALRRQPDFVFFQHRGYKAVRSV